MNPSAVSYFVLVLAFSLELELELEQCREVFNH